MPEQFILNVFDGDPNNNVWEHPGVKLKTETVVSDKFSRRDLLQPCMSQQDIGSCVGCSGAGVVADKGYRLLEDPSPMWIYQRAKFYDYWEGEDYSGTSILGACKALQKEGCCPEQFWPYENTEDTLPRDYAMEAAATNKITAYYKVPLIEVNQIKELLKSQTLWFSFDVYAAIYYVGSDGMLQTEGHIESGKLGGHAVALVGWKYVNDKLYWEVRNSWGSDWANDGYCWIEDSLFQQIVHGGMYVISLDTPIPPPPPKPEPIPEPSRKSWFRRLIEWIINLFK